MTQSDFNWTVIALGLVIVAALFALFWLHLHWLAVAVPTSILIIGTVYSAWERWRR